MSTWDKRWFGLAQHVSTWSKDPSTKVGAVIVDSDQRMLSMGWNGFPRGVKDSSERLDHRDTKYKLVVHAEANAIYNAGYNGVSLKDSTMYVHGLPCCNECAKAIIQSGVKRVYMRYPTDESRLEWAESFKVTSQMFGEAGVICQRVVDGP
jgi:dCMP deaminase